MFVTALTTEKDHWRPLVAQRWDYIDSKVGSTLTQFVILIQTQVRFTFYKMKMFTLVKNKYNKRVKDIRSQTSQPTSQSYIT